MSIKFKNAFYLPSGRVFLLETEDGYPIECTEMRDVSVQGKEHFEVRNAMDPHIIWKHLKPYEDKWLLTVSTQKGCTYQCHFCDVGGLPFKGNLTQNEIETQVAFLLANTPYVHKTNKAKIGFARMGEPAHNLDNVLGAMRNLPIISEALSKDFKWLPCFNSILPRSNGFDVIDRVIDFKESVYDGFLHFQISVNTTDEEKRKALFGGADVLTIEEIISHINKKNLHNRTVTLNFIVIKGYPIDVEYLTKLGLNGNKFCVKLIPMNKTLESQIQRLEAAANYENYEKLQSYGDLFNRLGVPTVVDSIAKCEEAGLCCGQLAHLFV